jgi:heavy metal efflux system protein
MFERILRVAIQNRWLVLLLTIAVVVLGLFSFKRLPIDAVPDITNNQVQINTVAPGLSTEEIEKQVVFPVETALAGIPGLESTRSLSRNGFSQVTAVFHDDVDVYFARQQVSERLAEARENLPPDVEPRMGAVSTGLGEIYMWTVEYEHTHGKGAPINDGKPGWQHDASYLTPEGQVLTTNFLHRRLCEGIPRSAGPDETRQLWTNVQRRDRGIGKEQRQFGSRLYRA